MTIEMYNAQQIANMLNYFTANNIDINSLTTQQRPVKEDVKPKEQEVDRHLSDKYYDAWDNDYFNELLDSKNLDDAITYFNKYAFECDRDEDSNSKDIRYGFTDYDNNKIVSFRILSSSAFKKKYMSFSFKNSKGRRIFVVDEWIFDNKIKKRVIKKMDYLPNEYMNYDSDTLNLWQGWVYKFDPEFVVDKSRIKTLLDHIKIKMFNGIEDHYMYFLQWLKCTLVGKKAPTSFSFSGPQGIGKNIIFEYIAFKIIGEAYAVYIDNLEAILAKFNSHLACKSFALCDELNTWAGDTKNACILKSRTANKTSLMEKKMVDAVNVKNALNYVYISNERNALRLEGKKDRHYIPVRLTSEPEKPEYYDNLAKDMDDTEIAKHFFHFVMQIDISKFVIQNKPITEEHKYCAQTYTPHVVSFLKNLLDVLKEKNKTLKMHDIYDYFIMYCQAVMVDYHDVTPGKFTRLLTKYITVDFRKRKTHERYFQIKDEDIVKQLKIWESTYEFADDLIGYDVTNLEGKKKKIKPSLIDPISVDSDDESDSDESDSDDDDLATIRNMSKKIGLYNKNQREKHK